MILDLGEFDEFPAHTRLDAPASDLPRFADAAAVTELTLELSIQQSREEYFCQGKLSATAMLECSRCLATYSSSLTADVNFIVRRAEAPVSQNGEQVIDDEDYVCFQGNDLRADLYEPVRQALVLSVPLRPMCAEGCRGLCPKCGGNLNESDCGCGRSKPDSRWEGLRSLLQR